MSVLDLFLRKGLHSKDVFSRLDVSESVLDDFFKMYAIVRSNK